MTVRATPRCAAVVLSALVLVVALAASGCGSTSDTKSAVGAGTTSASAAGETDLLPLDGPAISAEAGVSVPPEGTTADLEAGITLKEYHIALDQLDVKAGQVVKFTVANKGAVIHEVMFGLEKDQAAFEQVMQAEADHQRATTERAAGGERVESSSERGGEKGGESGGESGGERGGEDGGESGNEGGESGGEDAEAGIVQVYVGAGETATVSVKFSKPGTIVLSCHEPGHYPAGMKTTLVVT